jgi:hypothetical protein
MEERRQHNGQMEKDKRTNNDLQNIIKDRVTRTPLFKFVIVYFTTVSCQHLWVITGVVAKITRRVPLVEQELFIHPKHLSSPPVISGVRVTRSLIMFCRSLFVLLSFSIWPLCCRRSSIYRFWSPLWSLQTINYDFILVLRVIIFNQHIIPSQAFTDPPTVTRVRRYQRGNQNP